MKEDPKVVIAEAIAKLKEFSAEIGATKDPSLEKIVSLMRGYFKKKQSNNFQEIKRAIALLKSHYRFIEKLSSGTPQEQKLAASVLAAIEQYNQVIETVHEKPNSLNQRVQHFLLKESGNLPPQELSKIVLPRTLFFQVGYNEKDKAQENILKRINPYFAASQKITGLIPSIVTSLANVPHLSRQAVELFHMKALSLIERHGLLSKSDARSAMRKANIQTSLEGTHCHVSCTLSPFPGHSIAITAVFEKSPSNTGSKDIFDLPKREEFQLTLTATHTGFPHPSQYIGWALHDLVPPYPHLIEELVLLKPYYQRKIAAAQQLQPQGKLIPIAQHMQLKKREEAHAFKPEYLDLQQELWLTIARAASPKAHDAVVQAFFSELSRVEDFFDYYAQTCFILNESFVARPFAKLEMAWLEKGKIQPLAFLGTEVEKAKQEILLQKQASESTLEQHTLEFILVMGSILATPCHRIMLQHFSEMKFAPPMLDEFEQKIQASAYIQLAAFLQELEGIPFELNSEVQKQIALFSAEAFDEENVSEIVNELEGYFNSRYYTMLN